MPKYSFAILFFICCTLLGADAIAQKVTRVRGQVIDAKTGEVISFADVGFKGTSVGVSTDDNGEYVIETRFPSDSLVCSFLGYDTQVKYVEEGKRTKIDFYLSDASLQLVTVDILAKKQKYSKKNNPSLEFAKRITQNRDKNRLKSLPYYSYDKYDRLSMDINNITDKFKANKLFKDLDFVWDYIDTSSVNGKTYLPFFIREILSKVYYKKDGNTEKEYREAMRYSKLSDNIDENSLNAIFDALYTDIDIYADEIALLENQFVSPLAPDGVNFYRYYILDTITFRGQDVVDLAFIPAIKGNMGFVGNIFVTTDGKYTVLKVDMGVVKDINLNFARDVEIIQEFEQVGDQFVLTKDKVTIDFALADNGLGAYGTKEVDYSNYSFEPPSDMSVFDPLEKVINNPDGLEKPDAYWQTEPLYNPSAANLKTYDLADELRGNRKYQRYLTIGRIMASGYMEAGPFDLGPVATFASFNAVDGFNPRFGGETNYNFSRRIKVQGYLGRAFATEEWKYSAGLIYSFNREYKTNPRHYIQLTAERESVFPGQDLEFFSPNNFLLSFQRGRATNMLLDRTFGIRYRKEFNGYAYEIGARQKKRQRYGTLTMDILEADGGQPLSLDHITTTEGYIQLRYAPNEQFLQGQNKRRQLYNEWPIFNLDVIYGQATVGNRDIPYTKLYLNIFQQIEWTKIGTTDIIFDAGKTFGDLPYVLQFIPRGNQTYAYQLSSFNLMNFMEFAADQYVALKFEHFFYGYFLNRVPLIKKLKLREVISFKGVYGSLSDENNPNLNRDEIQYSLDELGDVTTFALGSEPYLEASFGLTNIFRALRVDIIKRFNYLDQPNLPTFFGTKGLGLRATFMVEF